MIFTTYLRRSGAALAAASAIVLAACDDTTTTIGSALVTDTTEIVVDSAFTVTGHSVANPVVQSRTLTQLLGRLDAREYGSIESDIVCQFMPSMDIDLEGVTPDDVDSVKLLMFMQPGDFTGDSLVPMGLEVYRLNRQLPSPIYSDFNPEGYYSKADLMGSRVYTANVMHSDSLGSLSYRTIYVDLPLEFGRQVFSHYAAQPEDFATPDAFSKWFPGVYITNTFGSGRVINITESRINLYYRKNTTVEVNDQERDTVLHMVRSYLAVTPEVVTNNNISLQMSSSLKSMASAGQPIVVAPVGMEIQLDFPLNDVIAAFRHGSPTLSVLNTLTLEIPAEAITNTYGIDPPQSLLLVLTSDKDKFFAENKVTDGTTSFLGTYNSTRKAYTFTDMRQYLKNMLEKTDIAPADYAFTLTPVNVETETTASDYYSSGATYVTNISPYVTKPAMAKILLDKAKIKLTFSRQSK